MNASLETTEATLNFVTLITLSLGSDSSQLTFSARAYFSCIETPRFKTILGASLSADSARGDKIEEA
ncbi:MAG: hypothetical protein HC933_12675 [Pleurocapsa sp. SU_196_0]|nr:hypothetical protein [Pleurocapsa sp. SU_196_0]